jgi:asparagine synthase (glutamine-hydrolysing)
VGGPLRAATAPHRSYTQIATLESALYLRNQLLRDTDWASMAHSLEVRTPLVDAWLLRTLAGPLATAQVAHRKRLLAQCPARPLPDAVVHRAKSGFTTPIADWQQRGDQTQTWRRVPALAQPGCPWARRWSYAVENGASPVAA